MRQGLGIARTTLVAAVLCAALPGVAHAYSTAPGYTASDYATGFPSSSADDWGPIGIAFDTSDNLYVADNVDGNIYRFEPGGGTASGATRLTQSPISGGITGLAVAPSGALYLARYHTGDVVQVDPLTGAVLRVVADVPCATGLAIDPVSGDLFVSENQCGSTIYRASGFASGQGTVTPYATVRGVDGLTFAPDGTLYAESDGTIAAISATTSSTPGAVRTIASAPTADGIAYARSVGGQPPFLVVNRNNGLITRVDLGPDHGTESDIFSGGSRGDFVAVDSSGCLFITQTSSIVRIAGPGGGCVFAPTTPGAAPLPAVVFETLNSTRHVAGKAACALMHSLKLRLSQQGRVRLRSARIYVNGKRVKQLTGRAVTAPVTLTGLPRTSFTVEVVAITTKGKRLTTTKHYANCARPGAVACVRTRTCRSRSRSRTAVSGSRWSPRPG
jgi:sugar lactone lactonase YvrE